MFHYCEQSHVRNATEWIWWRPPAKCVSEACTADPDPEYFANDSRCAVQQNENRAGSAFRTEAKVAATPRRG
eukprot:10311796-Lingulodinium_polyedra.AAC.1